MKKQSKWFYWDEDVYLFNIKYPAIEEYEDCGHKHLVWRKKGVIKLRTITHKRKRTYWDNIMDRWVVAAGLYEDNPIIENMGKMPKTIKFSRYKPLKTNET